jgi:peptide/nickel transport system permease protein
MFHLHQPAEESSVFGYIVRRMISGIIVLLAISFLTFALFTYGPRDPAMAMCTSSNCTPDKLERIRVNLGLERPFLTQYGEYMKGIFTDREISSGELSVTCEAPCLGISFKLQEPVRPYLVDRLPATISVAVGGAMIFLPLGVLIGVIAARFRGTMTDKLVVTSSLIISAVPYYLVALLAWLFLISKWEIFPPSGYFSPITYGPIKWIEGLSLAWLVIGVTSSVTYARFGRGSMVEALGEDYVRSARAKGVGERSVIVRHALRSALVPVITIFGLEFATLLAGTIFTEKIFEIEGVGKAAIDAISAADLPMIEATVLLAAFLIVVGNLVVDLAYSWLDPRVRL